jgi:hypothetical protein
MISTSGFTEGAVTMAQTRGITTRTYIDTESTDWREDVAIAVLVIRHEFRYQIGFANIPNHHFALPQNVPFQEIGHNLSSHRLHYRSDCSSISKRILS